MLKPCPKEVSLVSANPQPKLLLSEHSQFVPNTLPVYGGPACVVGGFLTIWHFESGPVCNSYWFLNSDVNHRQGNTNQKKKDERLFVVNTFNNVDFSTTWPCMHIGSPIRRPYCAAVRHGSKVGDEKAAIVSLGGLDTDAIRPKSKIGLLRPSLGQPHTNDVSRRTGGHYCCQQLG